MGERLLCKQEVGGSIPPGSIRRMPAKWRFSMWLGRLEEHPLMGAGPVCAHLCPIIGRSPARAPAVSPGTGGKQSVEASAPGEGPSGSRSMAAPLSRSSGRRSPGRGPRRVRGGPRTPGPVGVLGAGRRGSPCREIPNGALRSDARARGRSDVSGWVLCGHVRPMPCVSGRLVSCGYGESSWPCGACARAFRRWPVCGVRARTSCGRPSALGRVSVRA